MTVMSSSVACRRPEWSLKTPDYQVCYQEVIDSAAPPFDALIATMRLLRSKEVLLLRIGFEPALLLRVLSGKGLDSWTENANGDGMRIYFRKKPPIDLKR